MHLMLTCSELGLGHVSRIVLLGKKLEKEGFELFFYSGGIAYEVLKKEFRNVYYCTPVSWYENERGIILSASILNIILPLPLFDNGFRLKLPSGIETVYRYYDLRRNILKINPRAIISDGDLHALRLAERWGYPSVYITNLIRPSYDFPKLLLPGERLTERYVRNCSKIIIPDNPMPYTICEYNLGNLNHVGIRDKVEYVGSFMDLSPIEGEEKHIFASISGPLGTKAKLIKTVVPVLSDLKTKSIVSLGHPKEEFSIVLKNCTIHSWLPPQQRQNIVANAKIVIFSGGHTTCFETIKYMKPSICIPTQPEQKANALKLQELGCSLIAENKKQLKSAIKQIEDNYDSYKRNLERINRISRRFNGVERTIKVIKKIVEASA
ncbi:MAG: glycosyltransferase [Candidatus Bathyarchaeia archaeon]